MTNRHDVSQLAQIVALVAVATALPTSVRAQGPGPRQGDVTLTLRCLDSTHITLELKNVGATDTALRLGSLLGNGYMVDELDLVSRTPSGRVMEGHYSPREYPAVIGGAIGEWVEPLPARAAYTTFAKPNDFMIDGMGRLDAFPSGSELSLKWTVRAPRPQVWLLAYWSGTLTSNSCTP
jgi:hypothetical protein